MFLVCLSGGTTASPNLHWLRLPVVDTDTCAASYARFSANSRTPIIVGRGQLCVQGRANVDACQGIVSISWARFKSIPMLTTYFFCVFIDRRQWRPFDDRRHHR